MKKVKQDDHHVMEALISFRKDGQEGPLILYVDFSFFFPLNILVKSKQLSMWC